MNIGDIFSIWESSNKESGSNLDLSPERIREIIKPRVNKSMLSIKILIVTYLLAQFASIILLSYNLSLFQGNILLTWITAGMLICVSLFFFYGLSTLYRINKTNYVFKDLLDSVRNKLKLLRIDFEIWLWISSATLIILIFALNMMVDSVEGTYKIYNIRRVITIISIVFFFIYGMNKLSLSKVINEYKDYYIDLQNNALDRVTARDRWTKKYRVWIIIGLVILFILFLLAAIKGFILSQQFRV